MAAYSDSLLTVTIFAYLAAMLMHAAQYAFGQHSVLARAATRELAGAGGPPVTAIGELQAPAPELAGSDRRLGRYALLVTAVAAAAHAATVLTRSLAAGRLPWGSPWRSLCSP